MRRLVVLSLRKILLLFIFTALTGCSYALSSARVGLTDEERTLASLKRISDYPLYELRYYGDYGFEDYIQQGATPTSLSQWEDNEFLCSCFAALGDPQSRVFGRNFDWYPSPALVLFTNPPDGFASVSMVDLRYLGYRLDFTPEDDPQHLKQAPYFPFDGMNEYGLAVGMMAVPHAEGGNDPAKTTIGDLELIRYMLDYARDVPEAVKGIAQFNVDFGSVPVHFLIADAAGNAAVIEYLDGLPVVIPKANPWQVSTNFILEEEKPQGASSPCWRYTTVYQALEQLKGKASSEQAMDLLAKVSQGGGETSTRWSVVYDLSNRAFDLVMDRAFDQVLHFRLGE